MKVLQETPSLCLVRDPYFEFSEFWGTCKEPPDPHYHHHHHHPHPKPPFMSWIMCLYVLLVLQVFSVGHSPRWRLTSCCLNYQTDVLLICRKMFYCIMSSSFFIFFLLFLLSIFSFCRWYPRRRYLSGVRVYSCICPLILPINLTCTWETIY